jgi:hypothetical protein
MRRQVWSAAAALALMIPLGAMTVRAQDQSDAGQRRGQFAGMQRIGGTITAIAGPQVTIKTVDGAVYQVVTTDNTRVMHGRGEAIKLTDLKPGDGLMAMGNLDEPAKTMHAAVVFSVDADQMKRMEEARKEQLADLGKTLIAGRVTAIDLDNATMTVERPDGVSQTIGFDEGTSFRRGRPGIGSGGGTGFGGRANSAAGETAATPGGESITLADIKIGDRVSGPGQVKNGRFVPKELTVMTPGAGRHRTQGATSPGNEGTANGTPAPPSQQTPK